MNSKLPLSCDGCVLCDNPSSGKFTAVQGKGGFGVMIVAEASGEAEGATGLPLRPQAQSGSVFESAIRRAGWTRDQFWVTNILRCRPPRNWLEGAPWEREAIDRCQSNLQNEIERLKPRAIVALGGVATREMTGMSGPKRSVKYLRGLILPSRYGIPVIPSFHPSYLARGAMKYLGLLMADISKAIAVAQGRIVPEWDLSKVITVHESLDALIELYETAKANPSLAIGYDLETERSHEEDEDALLEFARDEIEQDLEDDDEDSEDEADEQEVEFDSGALDVESAQIKTIQFALNDREGVSVPWTEGYSEVAAAILALPNPKLGHNIEMYDNPILIRHGVKINGDLNDTLVAFRNFQPELPAHLQSVAATYWPNVPAWKHLSVSNLALYGVMDVCVLHRIWPALSAAMLRTVGEGRTVWAGYTDLTRPWRRVLDGMVARGLPVTNTKMTALRNDLLKELDLIDLQIQQIAPVHLRPIKSYEGFPDGYKDHLPQICPEWFEPTTKVCKNGSIKFIKNKTKVGEMLEQLMTSDNYTEQRSKLAETLGYELIEVEDRLKFGVRLPFNVRSRPQLLSYLRWKNYKIPVRFKDGKETTGDKELGKLYTSTKDPLIKATRDKRTTSKMIDSYTGKKDPKTGLLKGGWIPGADGRIRATFGYTATWQLAAKNPNILTLPKRRPELANRFRECIEARDGYSMVEIDYSAFHARTLGLAAQDARYMKLAAQDIHSFVTGHLVKWPKIEEFEYLSDDDQMAMLNAIKKEHKPIRDFKAKPSILGIGFGMGVRRLYFENEDSFANEAEARKLMDLIKRLFPKIFEWQEKICDQADSGKLVSKWGAVRWFWDVYKWEWSDYKNEWTRRPSKDAEKAKAFFPANHAHGMLRMKLLEMEKWGWNADYGLVNIVHDAVVFECPKNKVDDLFSKVPQWLMAPVLELSDPIVAPDGFTCGVESMVGPNLRDMEKIK